MDNATYSNMPLSQAVPPAGSTSTAAGFNGTSSYVQLPDLGLGSFSSQTMSLWACRQREVLPGGRSTSLPEPTPPHPIR
ncbi:hypothetical protein ABZV80_15070 [Streptomyces sp. NPDC005132]|uniref:hypothetical protein n=1 Tax=Streptomyces sp. NPDC005132 TaxID=3154294 RepID=UPI0033B34870